jgi:hypothetical protein
MKKELVRLYKQYLEHIKLLNELEEKSGRPIPIEGVYTPSFEDFMEFIEVNL